MPLGDDVQVISVDDHVIEHRDVWLDRVSKRFADDCPRIERAADGNDVWIYEGEQAGNFALNAVAGRPPKDFGMDPRTFDDMRPGCFGIEDRIRDMDLDGVWAELCFPNMAGFAGRVFWHSKDAELGLECVRAYNDFILDEWCAAAPARQIPLVMIPFWDLDAARAEVRRTAAKGARTATFPEAPHRLGLPSFHSNHWDPLLAEVEAAGLPLAMHFGSGGGALGYPEDAVHAVSTTLMGVNSLAATIDLMLAPTFFRFPDLKVFMAEGGIGWAPYALERADYVWDRHRWYQDIQKEIPPSEIFRRNIWLCFISDRAGVAARHAIGVDKIMFESDYPHSDSNFPHSRKLLAEALADVPDEEVTLMAERNARDLFQFPRTA